MGNLVALMVGYIFAGLYLMWKIMYNGKYRVKKSKYPVWFLHIVITLGWFPIIIMSILQNSEETEGKATPPATLEEALNEPIGNIVTPMTSIAMPGVDKDGNVFGDDILGCYDEYLEERKEAPRNPDEMLKA